MFILLKKFSSIKRNKVGSFLKLRFDLNQMREIVLKQNQSIWNFKAIEFPYKFDKYWRNVLKI